MTTNFRRAAAILTIAGMASACATSYVPVAGPGAVTQESAARDRAECRRKVDADARAAGKAVAGTAVGGAVGAAEGAISGAFFGASAEGALIGLAIGAVIGLAAGIAAATSDSDPALDACMAARGYRTQ